MTWPPFALVSEPRVKRTVACFALIGCSIIGLAGGFFFIVRVLRGRAARTHAATR
jgi:hypothetical protein